MHCCCRCLLPFISHLLYSFLAHDQLGTRWSICLSVSENMLLRFVLLYQNTYLACVAPKPSMLIPTENPVSPKHRCSSMLFILISIGVSTEALLVWEDFTLILTLNFGSTRRRFQFNLPLASQEKATGVHAFGERTRAERTCCVDWYLAGFVFVSIFAASKP